MCRRRLLISLLLIGHSILISSLVRVILTVWSMSLLQFSVTVMAVETRAKDREELKEQVLKEEALKQEERYLKTKRNQVRLLISGRNPVSSLDFGRCSYPCGTRCVGMWLQYSQRLY